MACHADDCRPYGDDPLIEAPEAPAPELAADLSPALRALEAAYRMIVRAFPDAPPVTIVIKRDSRAWGHTTVARVWAPSKSDAPPDRYEIMVSGENLRRGADAVAATLLHETAHARNLARGTFDTDVNGRHNRRFLDTALELGLVVEQAGWHGWTATSLDEDGRKRWRHMIKTIEAGIAKSAVTAPPPPAPPRITVTVVPPRPADGEGPPAAVSPRKRGDRNLTKAECPCGYSIRASRGVLHAATPMCRACGSAFAWEER